MQGYFRPVIPRPPIMLLGSLGLMGCGTTRPEAGGESEVED